MLNDKKQSCDLIEKFIVIITNKYMLEFLDYETEDSELSEDIVEKINTLHDTNSHKNVKLLKRILEELKDAYKYYGYNMAGGFGLHEIYNKDTCEVVTNLMNETKIYILHDSTPSDNISFYYYLSELIKINKKIIKLYK